jgi:hypothetical protein
VAIWAYVRDWRTLQTPLIGLRSSKDSGDHSMEAEGNQSHNKEDNDNEDRSMEGE